MIPIVPAIIPTSEADLIRQLQRLPFTSEIHVDVVDGVFTARASWPYEPAGDPVSVKPHTDAFTLEVDLMVSNPLSAAVDWITAGADMLVFHCETLSLDNFKNFAEYTHVSIGVACHGDTPLDTLLEYVAHADYVQLMGIKHIGVQGEPFDDNVVTTIQAVKTAYPDKPITVDGSVNAQTIAQVVAAGADRVIVGSAITLTDDPHAAYESLRALIK